MNEPKRYVVSEDAINEIKELAAEQLRAMVPYDKDHLKMQESVIDMSRRNAQSILDILNRFTG